MTQWKPEGGPVFDEPQKPDVKTFLKGMALGMAILVFANFAFWGAQRALIGKQQAGMDPERKITEIMATLDKYYVDDYDKNKLIESMYAGLVYGVGDPYTSYMDKDTLAAFYEKTDGKYAGIGVKVSIDEADNKIKIMTIFEGAPSQKAGLKINDKIVKVNGFDVSGDNYDDAINMIKGIPGTHVTLTILREFDKSTFEADVTRENIDVPTVTYKMLEDGIGYLAISTFDRVTTEQYMNAYNDLNSQGMKGLILDVRNNPGGLLDVVTTITDTLVPKGYIVYTEDKEGRREYIYSDDKRIAMPLAILVNGNSASASEVLSGAVQDTKTGVLVGTQTYGKGLVQDLHELSDGSGVKVTIAKYYTPNGICINGTGLTPDYVVEMDDVKTADVASLKPDDDEQLQKAVEIISEKIK